MAITARALPWWSGFRFTAHALALNSFQRNPGPGLAEILVILLYCCDPSFIVTPQFLFGVISFSFSMSF
jgi:hypothetical protein